MRILPFLLLFAFSGCCQPMALPIAPHSSPAVAVLVGLSNVDPAAYNGWAGTCPGTALDCDRMARMLDFAQVPYFRLWNETATVSNVLAQCREAARVLAPDGLLFLYFTGHGGQVADPADVSEIDGMSETICLFDGELVDNAIWAALQNLPAKVRVVLDADCCNSGTNYRARPRHNFRKAVPRGSWGGALLALGGCADGKASLGSNRGGAFTAAQYNAFAWRAGQTWRAWVARTLSLMPSSQTPSVTRLGADFFDKEVFK